MKKKSNDIAATTAVSGAAPAGADRGTAHHDEHEHEHDVGAGDVVAERDEDAGHEERSEGGDGEPDRPGRVIRSSIASCHTPGIPLIGERAKRLDALLTRRREP